DRDLAAAGRGVAGDEDARVAAREARDRDAAAFAVELEQDRAVDEAVHGDAAVGATEHDAFAARVDVDRADRIAELVGDPDLAAVARVPEPQPFVVAGRDDAFAGRVE